MRRSGCFLLAGTRWKSDHVLHIPRKETLTPTTCWEDLHYMHAVRRSWWMEVWKYFWWDDPCTTIYILECGNKSRFHLCPTKLLAPRDVSDSLLVFYKMLLALLVVLCLFSSGYSQTYPSSALVPSNAITDVSFTCNVSSSEWRVNGTVLHFGNIPLGFTTTNLKGIPALTVKKTLQVCWDTIGHQFSADNMMGGIGAVYLSHLSQSMVRV